MTLNPEQAQIVMRVAYVKLLGRLERSHSTLSGIVLDPIEVQTLVAFMEGLRDERQTS